MTAHVNAIRMIAFGRYAVDLVGREEFRATYEFDVVLEPIPTIVWSDAFEDEIGTLTRPGQEIASVVLSFHRLAQTEFRVRER